MIPLLLAVILSTDPDPRASMTPDEAREYTHRMANERSEKVNAEQDAQEAAAAAEAQKKCGKDFEHVRIGMRWKRVVECSGLDFFLRYQDELAQVYDSRNMVVRVERGRVVRLAVTP